MIFFPCFAVCDAYPELRLVYSFDTQEEETGIAALLRTLGEHSIEFKDLRSSESSLEDIFVSLVHQPKRAQE